MNEKERKYFKEVEKLGKKYEYFLKFFPPKFPKALNLQEEKAKFFRALADDKYYNPQIKFEKYDCDFEKLKELEEFKVDTSEDLYGFKKLYKERFQTKVYQVKSYIHWGKEESTKDSIKYWGKPSRFLLSSAKNFCKNYKREIIRFTVVDPKEVKKELKNEVLRLTGNKIKVKLHDIPSKVNIEPHENEISINPNERFTSLELARLKVHEIGVHYMRYFNGNKFGIKLLELGTANYVETEEGLAAYVEHLEGVSSHAQMFVYAGRVIATHYALHLSFYEVFEVMKNYGFSDQVAFAITYRAKRNLSDTSKSGGFPKDYVYYKGFRKISKYAKRHDISDLFIGKIKVEDVKLLRKFIDKNKEEIKTIFEEESEN